MYKHQNRLTGVALALGLLAPIAFIPQSLAEHAPFSNSISRCVAQLVRRGVSADEAARACTGEARAIERREVSECLRQLAGSRYAKDERQAVCHRTGILGGDCLVQLKGSRYSIAQRVQVCQSASLDGGECLVALKGSRYSRPQRVEVCRQQGRIGSQCLLDLRGSSKSNQERVRYCLDESNSLSAATVTAL